MVASDIIIGDISSIMVEALPLDIPLIHLVQRIDSLGLFEQEEYGSCVLGDVCQKPEELKALIDKNLKNDHFKKERNKWKEKLIFNFGKATRTAVDKILEIIKNEM